MNENFDYIRFKYGKEHLHEVYATMLNTFPNITNANVTGDINLWELLQSIKYNLNGINTNVLLTPKYIDGKKNNAYDDIKNSLPAVCYNSTFYGYKNLDHVSGITNLIFLDIDDFKSTEEAIEYKRHIILKYDWIVACSLSLSRLGLHIIIHVDKIHDNDDFNDKYDFISEVYFEGRLDKASKSLIRFAIIPADYSLYVNELPNVLNIEHIMKNVKKSTSSGYKKEKIITTPCMFSSPSPLKEILNDLARRDGLIFRQEIDESLFINPNEPLYYPEGKNVVRVNLYPYRDRKIKDGTRTSTLGGIVCRLIYLNAHLTERKDDEIKTAILKCVTKINIDLCEPPLTYKEVVNSFNDNWQKYLDGNLYFIPFFELKKVFWSRECSLSSDEKRKITCAFIKQPKVEETRTRIHGAIKYLHMKRRKISYVNISKVSGLHINTVYHYKQEINQIKSNENNLEVL
jgi:hypothetical protein